MVAAPAPGAVLLRRALAASMLGLAAALVLAAPMRLPAPVLGMALPPVAEAPAVVMLPVLLTLPALSVVHMLFSRVRVRLPAVLQKLFRPLEVPRPARL